MASLGKYPARAHAAKVASALVAAGGSREDAVIYLQGDCHSCRHDTDTEQHFRQESNFYYLSGVELAGFHLLYHLGRERLVLLPTRMPADEVVWHGQPPSLEDYAGRYDADEMRYADELPALLDHWRPKTLYTLPRQKLTALGTSWPHKLAVDTEHLADALAAARLIKDAHEVALMQLANKISSGAHVKLMQQARMGSNERELDALFTYEVTRQGCNQLAYHSIVGGGKHSAVLHYGLNNATLPQKPHELVLVDAGGEYNCYAADITRTWPIGGKFSGEARILYEIVLSMQKAVLEQIKPGVNWEDMHRLAMRICVDGLVAARILKGSIDELHQHHMGAIFFPHGLGHSIGLDVHDVGGYPKGMPRIDEPGLRYLRMRRKLEEGMVVTVEPGCYFVDTLLDDALEDPVKAAYINADVLACFRPVGGVRIEDCVVITANGYENLTSVPKEISEIEALMASASH
ncbi:peptidase M24, structural domain-containing protein [Syncephalis pseudoplumigaleata]|uniref:Peptidase M24, structural domain-containing protein n=1 Tax=Syncephalis pseudoplumigaleata TaxID=1712513 RepID=A0A4P9YX65_9FUNG|nr:peptidase M24, structural domain-containing protein [Syncephalis pseudoplumigaleata]|eukprot:RKP23540.1 peptidase M24, structural domain-containing protein [Syncephalis pseudoplumigaleata]